MSDRRFTLAEAQELVPWLREVFEAIEPLKAELNGVETRAKELADVRALRRASVQTMGGTRMRHSVGFDCADRGYGLAARRSVYATCSDVNVGRPIPPSGRWTTARRRRSELIRLRN